MASGVLVLLLSVIHTPAPAQDLTEQKRAYQTLLERYASGDVEGAAAAINAADPRQTRVLARLVVEDVEARMARLTRLSAETSSEGAPIRAEFNKLRRERLRLLKLSLLLHTEGALRQLQPQAQLRIARDAIERLESLSDDVVHHGPIGGAADGLRGSVADGGSDIPDLVKHWYLLVTSHLFAVRAHEPLAQHVHRGLEVFDDDAELLLARGSLWEHKATTMLVDRSVADEIYTPGVLTGWSQRMGYAASDYSRALRRRPDLHEARLRLGRINALRGRQGEAADAFSAVAESGAAAFLRYLARFFAGRLAEDRGDAAAAGEQYRAALALYPAAQAPKLALSLLCLNAQDRPCAERWLEGSMAEVRAGRDDPWWAYVDGQAWLTGPRLNALRQRGRVR